MPKRKTRVMVPFQGDLREILSVRENSKGELRILYKVDHLAHPVAAGNVLRVSERTSVHMSLESADGGFTIKNEMIKSDGSVRYEYHYVMPFKGCQIGPVLGKIVGSLDNPGYTSSPSQTDTLAVLYPELLQLGGCSGSLFYFLIVSRSGLDISDLGDIPLPVRELKFSRFTLFLVTGWFEIFGNPNTSYLRYSTAPIILNGEETLSRRVPSPYNRSPRPDELKFLIFQLLGALIKDQRKAFENVVRGMDGKPLSPETLDDIRARLTTIYPAPFAQGGINILLEYARLLADPPKDLWFPPSS